jgi:hypothetical protein
MENQDKRVVECRVYSRIVGYLSPVDLWNPGKAQEFKERKTYLLGLAVQREESLEEVNHVRAAAAI